MQALHSSGVAKKIDNLRTPLNYLFDGRMENQKPEKTWKQYALNMIHVIRGEEEFVGTSTVPAETALGMGIVTIVIILIIAFFVCYGAARLSWCYNTFYGASGAEKTIYSLLCFFFPYYYYPFYALFLDPICGRKGQRR